MTDGLGKVRLAGVNGSNFWRNNAQHKGVGLHAKIKTVGDDLLVGHGD